MNAEISRTFVVKLILICIAALVLNYFVVRPKQAEANTLDTAHASKMTLVDQGEQEMQRHRQQIEESVTQMSQLRQEMIEDLQPAQSLQSHQLLQKYAQRSDLTLTRIEPIKSVFEQSPTEGAEQDIKIELTEYRIECRGTFNAVVSFITEVQQGKRQGIIKHFRMVPLDDASVRAIMQVKLIELVDFPAQLKDKPSESESSSQQRNPSRGVDS